MQPLFDTHAHLSSSVFAKDLPAVLHRAQKASVTSILTVSETLSDAHAVLSLCEQHKQLHPALGLHPAHVATLTQPSLSEKLSAMTARIRSTSTLAAIGEVGLDYTPGVLALSPLDTVEAAREAQKRTFGMFLDLARELRVPVTAHSRGAGRHALDVVKTAAGRGEGIVVVMHAFDGRAVYAERALDALKNGLYFSVPPSVVRDAGMQKLVRRVPLERLLLESDAPALADVRGERNEPGKIAGVVSVFAKEKGVSESRVREVLWESCERVFAKVLCGGESVQET